MSDSAPIVETEFIYGTNVVNIGDLRVARGKTRREFSNCRHLQLIYDLNERRVWCSDCERPVESFDAFVQLVDRHGHIEDRIARLREADQSTIFSRAAKVMDKAFRSKNMAPCCPHCNQAILAADVATGVSLTNKDWESRRRAQKDKS